jgi:hypothetical protein
VDIVQEYQITLITTKGTVSLLLFRVAVLACASERAPQLGWGRTGRLDVAAPGATAPKSEQWCGYWQRKA